MGMIAQSTSIQGLAAFQSPALVLYLCVLQVADWAGIVEGPQSVATTCRFPVG